MSSDSCGESDKESDDVISLSLLHSIPVSGSMTAVVQAKKAMHKACVSLNETPCYEED